jgi:hypothetical protein
MNDTATRGAPAVLLGRCNPYGAESGGPRRVLGGMYGPGSARTDGMDLPDNVAQGEWSCPQPAQVRCRMICEHGHRGQVMALCSWHDDVNYRGEFVAGVTRRVSERVRVRGHFEEIQRRQSDSCPACLFPPPYGELAKEVQAWQAELSAYWQQGGWAGWRQPRAVSIRQHIDDAGKMMDAAIADGTIHKCPLTLVAVS